MNLMVVLFIMSVVCGIIGCALFVSGKEIGIVLIVVSGIIAGTSLSTINCISHDKSVSTAELVKIKSETNLPTTNEYYKVVVGSKMYVYKLIETK